MAWQRCTLAVRAESSYIVLMTMPLVERKDASEIVDVARVDGAIWLKDREGWFLMREHFHQPRIAAPFEDLKMRSKVIQLSSEPDAIVGRSPRLSETLVLRF